MQKELPTSRELDLDYYFVQAYASPSVDRYLCTVTRA
jgi:hypothetical protein